LGGEKKEGWEEPFPKKGPAFGSAGGHIIRTTQAQSKRRKKGGITEGGKVPIMGRENKSVGEEGGDPTH